MEEPIDSNLENTLFNQASYVGGVVLLYCALASAMYWLIQKVAAEYALSETLASAFAQVVSVIGLAAIASAWVASAAAPQDRRLVMTRMGWVFGPFIAMIFPLWLLRFGVWELTAFQFWIMFLPIPFISIFCIQVIDPVVRKWVDQKAQNPTLIARAEARYRATTLMSSESELRESEIVIPRESYLGLLAGVATILFLILETVLGEAIDNLIAAPGYIGASIVALLVAAFIYPLNRWASSRLSVKYLTVMESARDSDFSLITEIGTKSRNLYFNVFIVFIRHWYVWPFAVVLAIFFSKKIVLGLFSL